MTTATAIEHFGHWIDNAAIPGSGETLPVFNPATGEETGAVAKADAAQTTAAIDSAAAALSGWAATTPLRRARVLFRLRDLLEQHADELAALITAQHGKVISDAKGEVQRGLEVVEYACGVPELLKGERSAEVGTGLDSWSQRAPVGVVGCITPFNFPLMVPLWMIPVAIACGNTVVLKPSEKDPAVCLRLMELIKQAGCPDGVVNLVNGDRLAVDTLIADPRVQALSFVGSTPVAEAIYTAGAANGKRVQALGGAKNHALVLPDADLDMAANAIAGAAFGAAGERCMALSVVVAVGDQTADQLIAKLKPLAENLRIGDGAASPEPDMGPLISDEHRQRVIAAIADGVREGADLVVDGRDHALVAGPGTFLGGCIFDRVTADMSIYLKELFAPVLCIVRVPDAATGLQLINAHEYGNGTAIFTRDGGAARDFADRVQAGMIGINVPIPVPMAFHSFGGWKRSLFGPLHMYGPEGIRFFTKLKTITARWPDNSGAAEFSFPTL